MKGLLCSLALYCEQPADGVVPGSGWLMNAKIIAHKEVLQDEAPGWSDIFKTVLISPLQFYIMRLPVALP